MALARRGSSTWSQKTLTLNDKDDTSTLRLSSPTPSDDDTTGAAEGDYSSQMEEILGDNESDGEQGSDDEEGFLYQGEDAPVLGGYKEQLQELLGEEEVEELRVERELFDEKELIPSVHDDEMSDSQSSHPKLSPRHLISPSFSEASPQPSKHAFLHPTVSRLRSFMPNALQRVPSGSSVATTKLPNGSYSHSNFSELSRSSSISNLRAISDAAGGPSPAEEHERQAFRWTPLHNINNQVYSNKASAVLGSNAGIPTVLAANGLICMGTVTGRTFVFDFNQHLKCICGSETVAKTAGAVTALSLSYDHTFLAVGHATGQIHLYELSNPQTPNRSVPATTLNTVASGRKEGHLTGSRITHLGFVGSRHTAIVSADETGLAFYHSLGKVLFVEANDVLRILGKYPEEEPVTPATEASFPSLEPPTSSKPVRRKRNGSIPTQTPFRSRPRKPRKPSTILAMSPLPLGPSPYPTDSYNLIALLTARKLVIVGLKPSPRTWYRCHREGEDEIEPKSLWRGCLAWFPSTIAGSEDDQKLKRNGTSGSDSIKKPTLAYTWGRALKILNVREEKVKHTIKDPKTGKPKVEEIGELRVDEIGRWTIGEDVLAIQWLSANQLILLTTTQIEVWDIRLPKIVERTSFDSTSLISMPLDKHQGDAFHPEEDISHSLRVYKGKVFLLGRQEIRVGRLLSWADRILSFVQDGDFLKAIDLTRAYYVGEAPGNKNGLPEDPQALREVVGTKLRDMMVASARYTFSEDRMTDGTHITPDGRGVDRTPLFEGLVSTCAKACLALDDFEFLFEDLFERYNNSGIAPIFLTQLEPFILDGTIHVIPPYVTQKLIAYHQERGDFEKAERIIWHIDPMCLDINQAIVMCQEHELFDALIYVYTRSLQDYVSPVVELLGLIRKIQQRRKERLNRLDVSTGSYTDDVADHLIPNAYKIYTYLADILSGLTYPSQEPIPYDEASQARKDVYSFLFFGRSSVWPVDSGKLVLTADEDGGVEPTYPYLRLLLRFDSESFLHALDIAFEDSYLNDESRRLTIINIMLEILASPGLSPNDVTFIRIFIARNVPKYPQYISIYMAPSTLQGILIGLASDPDQSTREDRQLAAEFLLSAYTPHESDRILRLFEEAGFYRILRTWHSQEGKWTPLISTYLQDPDISMAEVFPSLHSVLARAAASNKKVLPLEVVTTIVDALPQLLDGSITQTATLLDAHTPASHAQALEILGEQETHRQFIYLRCLLQPSQLEEELDGSDLLRSRRPSTKLDQPLHHLYIQLLCQFDAPGVIGALKTLTPNSFEWEHVLSTCEDMQVYDALVWSLDRRGQARAAFDKLHAVELRLAADLASSLTTDSSTDWQQAINQLTSLCQIGIRLGRDHSSSDAEVDLPLEEMWFTLLQSQIEVVQAVSSVLADISDETQPRQTLDILRSLVQETFSALMLNPSTKAISFPRLFKRLVESTSKARSSSRTLYSEFRLILTGMLDSYRSEGDLLTMTNRLVERDLFDTVDVYTKHRMTGWRASFGTCEECGQPLFEPERGLGSNGAIRGVSRHGNARLAGKASDGEVVAEHGDDRPKTILILNAGYAVHARCREQIL